MNLDFILIDPTILNLLTVNAMVASHSVLVPLQSEFFALEGLSQFMLSIREARQSANTSLLSRHCLTMYIANNLSNRSKMMLEKTWVIWFDTIIPRNVRVSEVTFICDACAFIPHISAAWHIASLPKRCETPI